jgi:hypothetical protein
MMPMEMFMRSAVPLLFVAVLAAGSTHAQSNARIEDAAWLAGCWSIELPDGIIEEHWLPPAGGAMLGLSRTVRGGRMTEFEFISIRFVDGKLAYVAIPSRQAETVFPLVQFSSNVLVFENPRHDYPQRITYRREGDGLTARIEGDAGGKHRSSDYIYQRCDQS